MASRENEKQKLEWMYKGTTDLLNREEYLLGRTIDKNFEQLNTQEKAEQQEKLFGVQVPKNHVEYECIPFSIREYKNLQNSEQVDIQRKLMEDPLMAIKQKEMETRRKILENPVKLKEIHKILKTEKSSLLSSDNDKKKEKKTKKSKKKKKYSSSSSSSSSESDSDSDAEKDLDKLLAKKYKKVKHSLDDAIKKDIELDKLLKNLNKKKKSKKSRNNSSTESEQDSPRSRKFITKGRQDCSQRYSNTKNKRSYSNSSNNSDYDSKRSKRQDNSRRSPERDFRNKNYTNKTKYPYYKNTSHYDRNYKRNIRRSISSEKKLSNSIKNREYNDRRKIHNNDKDNKSEIDKIYGERKQTDKGNLRPYSNAEDHKSRNKVNITEEEKEKRLKEMMADAAKRDVERTNKVNKYRKDCEEEEIAQKNRQFDDHFAKNELKKALSSNNTVESRIKSKMNNIQRSAYAMDSNFARK